MIHTTNILRNCMIFPSSRSVILQNKICDLRKKYSTQSKRKTTHCRRSIIIYLLPTRFAIVSTHPQFQQNYDEVSSTISAIVETIVEQASRMTSTPSVKILTFSVVLVRPRMSKLRKKEYSAPVTGSRAGVHNILPFLRLF